MKRRDTSAFPEDTDYQELYDSKNDLPADCQLTVRDEPESDKESEDDNDKL
jgi:hypothetical protein